MFSLARGSLLFSRALVQPEIIICVCCDMYALCSLVLLGYNLFSVWIGFVLGIFSVVSKLCVYLLCVSW